VSEPTLEAAPYARLAEALQALAAKHSEATVLLAWLANGEFVLAGNERLEVAYTIADEPGGGRALELRLRRPPAGAPADDRVGSG
jgi:hypothetical protein